jgi:hypothetical protein
LEMRESVKSSVTRDAAIRSQAKRRQHVSLDKTAPTGTKNLLTPAVGTVTFKGAVHFRSLGALSNGRRFLINRESIADVHLLEYTVVRRIDGEGPLSWRTLTQAYNLRADFSGYAPKTVTDFL